MTTLSAFVITRDGAALLPAVIANLRHFVDEVVVVVDAETRDDSWPVAHELADRAELWPLAGGVPEAVRNEAAALCRGDWIFMLDDDELVPPALQARIPFLLRMADHHEFVFPRKHIVSQEGRWITSRPWWPDYQVRLRSRHAWQTEPWPRLPHSSPVGHCRMTVETPFWHLKFMVRRSDERIARMNAWGAAWSQATNDHYRRFSLPENYDWQTGPCDEEPPAEFSGMLAAGESNKEAA